MSSYLVGVAFPRVASLLVALGCVCAASPARAENPSAKLVSLLSPRFDSDKPHPLADGNGRIPFLLELRPGEDARSLGLFEMAPGVASGRLDPLAFADLRARHPGRRISVTPRMQPTLDVSRERSGVKSFVEQTGGEGTGKGVVVGVVDTGIDTTHPAFFDEDGNSRIAWLLTWGPPRGIHPEIEDAMGCTDPAQSQCAVFAAEDLPTADIAEDLHDFVGHGTHVTSIAAGTGRRNANQVIPPKYVSIAPEATIVFAAPSKNGGFADDEIIRGTKFVFDRADAMGMPAVVNLSLGGDFGPHDGTSLLEAGVAAFVGDDKPGRVIVAAAGNSGGLYQVGDVDSLGIHTEVHVEDHAPARIPIYVPGATGGNLYVWATFRPGDEVTVGLEGPNEARWISQVSPGEEAGYSDDEVDAAVINNLVNENSSLNSDTNSAVLSWNGTWETDSGFAVTLEGHGDAQLWVVGQGAATQGAYFVQGTKQGTVNLPGTHPRLMAVGCTVNRLDWMSIEGPVGIEAFGSDTEAVVDSACYFSGAGPTPFGVPKPEISAPGAFIGAAMGIDADPRTHDGTTMFTGASCPDDGFCNVLSDNYAIATGTSMSAPHVSGAVALLLQQDPSLTQASATEILQASARKPKGNVDYGSQIGAGALDLTHALQALAEEPEIGAPPDVGQSFWFLSAESARPDPTWPVTGSISLRREDGSIASGLDGSLLDVEVEGGTLVRAPGKIRHGFFQFVVAAARGDGQKTMTIRVLYDGKQIGETATIPIAIDQWAAGADVTADGGLSCSATGKNLGRSALALSLFGIALVVRRRPRRRLSARS